MTINKIEAESDILVSILINNYNYAEYLSKSIDSALAQTYLNTEVVVVDDGSTDGSREIIESYGKRIVSVLKDNAGQASAINEGFLASKGKIVCLLDSDDIFTPEKVNRIRKIFNEYEDIGWCFHRLRFVNEEDGSLIRLSRENRTGLCDYRDNVKKGRLPFTPPATSGLCFSRPLLEKILPMPQAEGVVISDHYLKTVAVAISKGYFLDEELAIVNVHGSNRYTETSGNTFIKAKIATVTAYHMKQNWPVTHRLANKLFITGLILSMRKKNRDVYLLDSIERYGKELGLLEKAKVYLKAYFRFFKASI